MKVRFLFPILLLALCLPLFGQKQPPASTSQKSLPVVSTPSDTSVPDLKPGADGKLSQEQMRQLFRVVADKDIENNYTGHGEQCPDRDASGLSQRFR